MRRLPLPGDADAGGVGLRFIKKIGERGIVTLPSDVRLALGLGEGDIVELELVSVVRRAEKAPPAGPVPAAAPDPSPAARPAPAP